MKRLFTLVALLMFVVSGCANNTNMISVSELTERENAILSTTSDKSFVFDFQVDSEYTEVTVWIEKYESGKLIDKEVSSLTTDVKNRNGSIIFTNAYLIDGEKNRTFNLGISNNGGVSSVNNLELTSNASANMASTWSTLEGKVDLAESEQLLAGIGYSSDEIMSSLSSDIYEDFEGQMNELEKYDVLYLLKVKFNK